MGELGAKVRLGYAPRMGNQILAANVTKLRKHLGLKQDAFADKLEVSQGNVSKWESKGIEPGSRTLARMSQWAGCSVEDFIDRPWNPPSTPIERPKLSENKSSPAGDDTVEITQLDLSFSMGPGTALDDYIEQTRLRFDLDYIRSFTRTPPHRLHLARGVGESMFPTLVSSDMVWIDTTQRTLNQQDRIWAISLYGAAAIKRLRTIKGGKVLVISDNPNVENQEVDAEDIIIGGRVFRFEREL